MEKKSKLSEADRKFIIKFLSDKLDFESFDTEIITRKNKHTGEIVEMDPICAACYDFVIKLNDAIWINAPIQVKYLKEIHPLLKPTNAIMYYDRARYLILKLNPEAYNKLVD